MSEEVAEEVHVIPPRTTERETIPVETVLRALGLDKTEGVNYSLKVEQKELHILMERPMTEKEAREYYARELLKRVVEVQEQNENLTAHVDVLQNTIADLEAQLDMKGVKIRRKGRDREVDTTKPDLKKRNGEREIRTSTEWKDHLGLKDTDFYKAVDKGTFVLLPKDEQRRIRKAKGLDARYKFYERVR